MDRDIERRNLHRARQFHIDAIGRPGRESQATVGHVFLTRAALTKSLPWFWSTYSLGDDGLPVQTNYALYGISTYGGDDVYAEDS